MIIFMGVAGSGKSVQGRRLADELGLPWLSTGEFLRMLISGERRKAMVQGELLGDAEIIELVQKIFSLINSKEEFILDGFPRTPEQADWLLSQVRHKQLNVTAVIHIKASAEVVTSRLLSRGRPDDTREALQQRFDEYEKAIRPIISEMKAAQVPVFDINGEGDIEVVHDEILGTLKTVL
ncbi:nucleoside monophosphate kinase [Candidatus Saccharibacteria bacterium]|nr:nucleoside monophosphate kinase [Candidatus Saccharibacteria bacterium]